jgi:hypothetical protein
MARLLTWETIGDYFSLDEFGEGAARGMDDAFLISLYEFRIAMDNPILIHDNGGFSTKGHSPKSFHYQGRAVDFHFKYKNVSLRRLVVSAIKCGFYGIGIYPHWSPKPGGFHLDNRPGGMFNIWSRGEDGMYHYIWPSALPESLEEWRDK